MQTRLMQYTLEATRLQARRASGQALVTTAQNPANVHSRGRIQVLASGTTGQTTASLHSKQEGVMVFTTTGCPYCQKAKRALTTWDLPYQEVDVSNNVQIRSALKDVTGSRTVPQVFVNGILVGGSDDLSAKLEDGSLQQLLSSCRGKPSLPKQLQDVLSTTAPLKQRSSGTGGTQQLPSDLHQLVTELSNPETGILRHRRTSNSPSTFTGQDLISWLVKRDSSSSSSSGSDRTLATVTAQQLFEANVVTLVSDKQPAAGAILHDDAVHSYGLRSRAAGVVSWGRALNTHYWWGPRAARAADEVAEDLRSRILQLYNKHLSSDGRAVSYKAMKADPKFWEYVDATAELQRVDLSGMSREALMCFAINLYNALVVHTLVVHGPEQYNSSLGRLGFFQKAAKYNIGGHDYVLDDLENGILRGNRPAASSVGMLLGLPQLSSGPFGATDPRREHFVSPVDPRIHFTLVCGAKSCPPIKLYSPESLEEGLTAAAEAFIAADVEVDNKGNKVQLSKIFSWYYPDFGADKAERLRFLLPYLPQGSRTELQQMLAADPAARRITVKHKPYDWRINATADDG